MTAKEFEHVARLLKIAYRRDNFLVDDDDMEFWYERLKGFRGYVVKGVANAYIKNNRFQPTIADMYVPCDEFERSAKNQIRDLCDLARAGYPGDSDLSKARELWSKVVHDEDWNVEINNAKELERKMAHFVRACELDDTIDDIPTFEDYLRGLMNESAS